MISLPVMFDHLMKTFVNTRHYTNLWINFTWHLANFYV